MKYAPGLSISWTEKELNKIREIKNRERTEDQGTRIGKKNNNSYVPWKGIEEYKRAEKKYHRDSAITSLYAYGWSIIEIAELFDMAYKKVFYILHREGR